MSTRPRHQVPLAVSSDPNHGGRWTSLRAGEREWLWTNPDPTIARQRLSVTPAAAFVDAGGVEECFPTVRGQPDHGDAWTRPWSSDGSRMNVVEVPGYGRLSRLITNSNQLRIDYRLSGRPGTEFLHAVHALLDLSPRATLSVPAGRAVTVLDVPDPDRIWPDRLQKLGPDDGTAICVLIPDCSQATVTDGDHALHLAWDAPGQSQLCSLLFWRNLRGWPTDRPYRSIGVEPMVGRAADLTTAAPADRARIGPSGVFAWTLTITALNARQRADPHSRRASRAHTRKRSPPPS